MSNKRNDTNHKKHVSINKIEGIKTDNFDPVLPLVAPKKTEKRFWWIFTSLIVLIGLIATAIAVPLSLIKDGVKPLRTNWDIPTYVYHLNGGKQNEFTTDITKGDGYEAPIQGVHGEAAYLPTPTVAGETIIVDGQVITSANSQYRFKNPLPSGNIYQMKQPGQYTTDYMNAKDYVPARTEIHPNINDVEISNIHGGEPFDETLITYDEIQQPVAAVGPQNGTKTVISGVPSDWDATVDGKVVSNSNGNIQIDAAVSHPTNLPTWTFSRDQVGIDEKYKYYSFIDIANNDIVNFHSFFPESEALLHTKEEFQNNNLIPGSSQTYRQRAVNDFKTFLKTASRIEVTSFDSAFSNTVMFPDGTMHPTPDDPNWENCNVTFKFVNPAFANGEITVFSGVYITGGMKGVYDNNFVMDSGSLFGSARYMVNNPRRVNQYIDSFDENSTVIDQIYDAFMNSNILMEPYYRYVYSADVDGHEVQLSHIASTGSMKSNESFYLGANKSDSYTTTNGEANEYTMRRDLINREIKTNIDTNTLNLGIKYGTPAVGAIPSKPGIYNLKYNGYDVGIKVYADVLPTTQIASVRPVDGTNVIGKIVNGTPAGTQTPPKYRSVTPLDYNSGRALSEEKMPAPVLLVPSANYDYDSDGVAEPISINEVPIETEQGVNWEWTNGAPVNLYVKNNGRTNEFVTDETQAKGYVEFKDGALPPLLTPDQLVNIAILNNSTIYIDGKQFTYRSRFIGS